MKYVKGKIDKVDIEVNQDQSNVIGMLFTFLKCKHCDIDTVIKMTDTKHPVLGEILGIPNIKVPHQYNR